MRSITCICENSFEADLPEEIDLDAEPGRIEQILGKDFFVLSCPSCGTKLEPELRVRFLSRKRSLDLVVIPELERVSLYRGKVALPKTSTVLVGYNELRERIRMLADDLDPESIEILKYFLLLKAEEASPDSEISVLYSGSEKGELIFHIRGIKEGETAVARIGRDMYDAAASGKARTMRTEPFDRMFAGPYRSVRSLEAEED
ncbi:MAG TPA: CpXC domain-containing protein [Rectinemataceae bacterium]|nr:CpXC domain-containing protein [Rectinemataceae bacterium]